MSIQLQSIGKRFGDFVALDNVSLEIGSGELVALLGPSGSGKTTLLRIISGLERADSGKIMLNSEEATGKHVQERNVGFMFQHYALFRHMTVLDNVAFGMRVQPRDSRPSDAAIRSKVMELLKLVHLDGLHGRYPSQLSGGQRQRVALARALAVQPKVLLLDEPFGALDAKVRKELRRFMRKLHEDIHVTTVFVTHDQEEAMEVADRVVVMSNGKIEQVGSPDEVWNRPNNSFVYDFLGNYNQFDGVRTDDGEIHLTEYETVEPKVRAEPKLPAARPASRWWNRPIHARDLLRPLLQPRKKWLEPPGKPEKAVRARAIQGTPIKVFVRPHEMFITTEADGHDYIKAKVVHINPAGPLVKLEMERANGSILQAEIPAEAIQKMAIKNQDQVLVRPKSMRVFE